MYIQNTKILTCLISVFEMFINAHIHTLKTCLEPNNHRYNNTVSESLISSQYDLSYDNAYINNIFVIITI